MYKILTVEELARDAFEKSERVRMLGMRNTPTDYEERKKAFVDLAVARAAAAEAEQTLVAAYKAPAPPIDRFSAFQGGNVKGQFPL